MSETTASTQPKDEMIKCNSVSEGKNSKGGDRYTLRMTPGEAAKLVEAAGTGSVKELGLVLDIHISDREYEGRTFRSCFFFAREKRPRDGQPVAQDKAGEGSVGTGDVASRIAALKSNS